MPATLEDEWDAIALNYTSGTTGDPKGVVYHHRGAYLNAARNIVTWGMPPHSVYLWTLPMFHCNGWCFPWTMAANGGVNVCLRRIDPQGDFRNDRRAQGHAFLRRAHRAWHADRARSGQPSADRPQGRGADRRRRAARRDHRGHGKARRRHHPCLRPDRDLWPGLGLRQAGRMGNPAAGQEGGAEWPPGRPLDDAGGHRRGGRAYHGPGAA